VRCLDYPICKTKIVDTLLTLIFRMGLGACSWGFCPERLPKSQQWMAETNRNIDYAWCKAKNLRHTVDAHSQNGAVTTPQYVLPIMAANTSDIHDSNQITVQLLYLRDPKSFMLHWRSFQCIVDSTSTAPNDCIHNHLNWLVAFLTDWDSTLW